MPKKTKKLVVFLSLFIFAFLVWFYWQNNSSNQGIDDLVPPATGQITYFNSKYNYSLNFPEAWLIDYSGKTKETADFITFAGNDTKVQIIIQDIKELQNADDKFPQINSINDWINWERTYQVGFDTEALGKPIDEYITISNRPTLKSSYLAPLYPDDMGKEIKVSLLNPTKTHIFQIQYLGQEPEFTNQLQNFDLIINSFNFSSL